MVFVNESCRPDAVADVVTSYEQWCALSGSDYQTPRRRAAWQDGREVEVMLPPIPARARSLQQYKGELESAGFRWVEAIVPEEGRLTFVVVRR
jgi:hypothetical protein